jgi:uncharacterized OB-fold protein
MQEEIARFGGRHSFAMLWRFNPEWYHLMGSQCQKCGQKHYPRKAVCVYPCDSTEMEEIELSHQGRIEYAGLNNRATDGYADVHPQAYASVKLEDGPHVVGELVNLPLGFIQEAASGSGKMGQLAGARVRMVIRRFRKHDSGDITYGHKFELIEKL